MKPNTTRTTTQDGNARPAANTPATTNAHVSASAAAIAANAANAVAKFTRKDAPDLAPDPTPPTAPPPPNSHRACRPAFLLNPVRTHLSMTKSVHDIIAARSRELHMGFSEYVCRLVRYDALRKISAAGMTPRVSRIEKKEARRLQLEKQRAKARWEKALEAFRAAHPQLPTADEVARLLKAQKGAAPQ